MSDVKIKLVNIFKVLIVRYFSALDVALNFCVRELLSFLTYTREYPKVSRLAAWSKNCN